MKYVAKYYTLNDEDIVTNIYDAEQMMLPEGDYVRIHSSSVAKVNSEIIARKNLVKIKKGVNKTDLLSFKDFTIEQRSAFDIKKEAYKIKVQNSITDTMCAVHALDIFEYLEIFSAFLDRGIFITEKNREEKYLEVINTADEDLIENLERYLEIKDAVRPIANFYKNSRAAIKRLDAAETEEDLDNILEDFKKGAA